MQKLVSAIALSALLIGCAAETTAPSSAKPVTAETITDVHPATVKANKASVAALDFSDRRDYERAKKGFIATFDEGIPNYDPTAYDFLKGDAPDSVNPSLWRQSQLLSKHGLFKVTDGVYQVRSFDLSNITFIEGKTGWIVVDPLITKETAARAKVLVLSLIHI